MDRIIAIVGLVAALAGTPSRMAEAADDLTRVMAEGRNLVGAIERVDGGVGDEPSEAVRDDAPINPGDPRVSADRPDLHADFAGASRAVPGRDRAGAGRRPPSPARPRALLQRFRC